jgi:hypothetical protein
MKHSKLEFSPQQLSLLTDTHVWNERRRLAEQIGEWMGDMLLQLKQSHQGVFEKVVPMTALNGKITKGDNYNGFPYLLLDYPNYFAKDEIVSVRNLIWFGNDFHCTFHLRGKLIHNVMHQLSRITSDEVFICTAPEEWIHHIEAQHWTTVNKLSSSLREQIETQGWLKLGVKLEIDKPETWTNALVEAYATWVQLIE